MRIHGVNATISLLPEGSLRIQSGRGVEIRCLSGLLWVTQAGDARDLFAASGQALRLVPRGLTLVTALEPSLLHAQELPALARRRAWRWPWRVVRSPVATPLVLRC